MEEQRRQTTEKLATARRAARDLEIARQVQARLFPQRMPQVRTLEYAGACIQARHVGGDYYDFLDLGRGRLGLIIADIAGKGIAAALLMANLQANLRSQCASASDQPQQFLRLIVMSKESSQRFKPSLLQTGKESGVGTMEATMFSG